MAMQNRTRLLEKLKRIQGAPRKAMRAALEQGAKQIVSTAQSLVPVKSGALSASISYTFGTYTPDNSNVRGVSVGAGEGDADLSVTIHAGDAKAFYAAFVEHGTNPHYIAKGGGTKIGQLKGRMTKGAMHPGAKASPFFFPAYRANKRSVKARISRAMNKAIKESIR